jgi:hypothetical protein
MSLLPGLRYAGVTIERATADSLVSIGSVESDGATIPVGVDWPVPVPLASVETALRRIGPGSYGEAFMPHSSAAEALLGAMGIEVVLMLRDPRDVAVSHSHFVAGHAAHFLHKHYRGLSSEERLTASIVGVPPTVPGGPLLLDVRRRTASMAAWIGKPGVFRTDFSRLVGPQGGGSAETQRDELQRIVSFIGLRCTDEELSRIARLSFWRYRHVPQRDGRELAQRVHRGAQAGLQRLGRAAAHRARLRAGHGMVDGEHREGNRDP